MSPAELLLAASALYLSVGALVAIPFALLGVQRVDPAAAGWSPGNLVFRLMILPGCAALWPLVLRRWRAGGS